ncbi:hypothetical protein [Enterococcus avium]
MTITHRQEEPFFIEYHECRITDALASFSIKKLWVIDDHTHQTMSLPEEY